MNEVCVLVGSIAGVCERFEIVYTNPLVRPYPMMADFMNRHLKDSIDHVALIPVSTIRQMESLCSIMEENIKKRSKDVS